ncbi:hypothetical protein CDL12_08849 [Handroanthus impetiginosus]|uniref:Uncharacterized protein n=1 Tax=Handroanthus impetiginosus TaxID=429701 RepID=A0A2G9HLS6_9LAMI|nr:hypothetical protein CDL12_08849 [Handroanthus impetiginosus]
MQTSKSRANSLDVAQKPSPAAPKTARKLKAPGSDADSGSSPNQDSKTPKVRSTKVVDRKSPRIPAIEKKKPGKVAELEAQIAQLQEELKKAKEQLSSSESSKRRAQQEAEEAKKQLAAMSANLGETQKQLNELSESEEARVQELRKISQDRDRAWQSELEAVQKQHSMDSAALASARNEMQKLKIQLERVSQSEASHARHAESAHAEIKSLRLELTETLVLVQKLKDQLNDSREAEAQVLEDVGRAQMQLGVVKASEERLRMEHSKAMESYNSLLVELEQSKNRVSSLEELVSTLRADPGKKSSVEVKTSSENGERDDESEALETGVNDLKNEVRQLRAALEEAERRYRDEYIQSTLQIRNAYDMVENAKLESSQREADLEKKLKNSIAEVEKLQATLVEKENELQNVLFDDKGLKSKSKENQPDEKATKLEVELKESGFALEELKASLLDKETELQSIIEENDTLKSEILKWETEQSKVKNKDIDAIRAAENEALIKFSSLTEEADKSYKKAAEVTEQLDAAQASNSDLEAELRRLKIQCDQWRKAAEAAAAMLSTGNNEKPVEKMGSFDYHTLGSKLSYPHFEDTEDESPKKKNGSMLKKIGVLLKKGQK